VDRRGRRLRRRVWRLRRELRLRRRGVEGRAGRPRDPRLSADAGAAARRITVAAEGGRACRRRYGLSGHAVTGFPALTGGAAGVPSAPLLGEGNRRENPNYTSSGYVFPRPVDALSRTRAGGAGAGGGG